MKGQESEKKIKSKNKIKEKKSVFKVSSAAPLFLHFCNRADQPGSIEYRKYSRVDSLYSIHYV